MKYLLLFFLTAVGPAYFAAQSATNDERAIRAVIERETQAYLDRKANQQADCWATHTALSQRVTLDGGHLTTADGDQVSLRRGLAICFQQLSEPDRATFTNQDYRVRIRGDAAFVTFGQVLQPMNRPANYSQQVRYLEREVNGWKIVHSGVMYYQPTPARTQASR